MQIEPVGCTLSNLVGDRYDFDGQCTLKSGERQRIERSERVKEFHPPDNFEIPNWKNLMKNSNNKANLLNYIAASVSKQPEILPRRITYILGGMMEDSGQTIVLKNSLSEVFRQTRAVIHPTDTDITMLSCYYLLHLEGLQKTGFRKRQVHAYL